MRCCLGRFRLAFLHFLLFLFLMELKVAATIPAAIPRPYTRAAQSGHVPILLHTINAAIHKAVKIILAICSFFMIKSSVF